MKLMHLTVAHAHQAVQRGAESARVTLHEQLVWNIVAIDTKTSIADCLLFVLLHSGSRVRRPQAQTLHLDVPCQIVYLTI